MSPDSDPIFRRLASKAKFRHLGLLIQLHDLRNMKRAAEALGLSQPAVSLAVSELEKLLGVTLFLRHARGVEPTQAAIDLVPVARRIMAALGDGAEIVSSVLSDSAGFVRIGATPAALSAMVQPLIGRLAEKYPALHLEVIEVATANPLEAISDGVCDILCLRQLPTTPADWQFDEVMDDALVVVCGAGHPLAREGRATRAELARERWLLARRGSIARERFEDLAEDLDLPADQRCGVVTHVPMLTQRLLTQEGYLALLPRSVTSPWQRDGLVVELDSPATTRLLPMGVMWRAETATRLVRRIVMELTG